MTDSNFLHSTFRKLCRNWFFFRKKTTAITLISDDQFFVFFFSRIAESLAHEIEMERKTRQQTGERDVKSPLQERPNYYKNSVLFSSAT